MKNEFGKLRNINNPYEVWKSFDGQWTWRVLKKYKTPDKENSYSAWFCAVKTPYLMGGYELGDVYIKDIKAMTQKVESPVIDKW